jgi:hypothetical protein
MTCQRIPWKTKVTNHISQEPLSFGAPLHQIELGVGVEKSIVHDTKLSHYNCGCFEAST